MRNLMVALISALAISVPFVPMPSALANEEVNGLSYSQGLITSMQLFSDFESEKALNVLDSVEKSGDITVAQQDLLDLMKLMIYRHHGNILADGLPEDGIVYLTKAIVLDDSSAHVRTRRAQAYCEVGNFEYCQRDFAMAWKLTKDKSPKWLALHLYTRGSSYQGIGRIQEGNADLKEAARLSRLEGNESRAKFFEILIRTE